MRFVTSSEPVTNDHMQKRKLGDTGLEIAPLVFGGNVFGWTADEKTSYALLDSFMESGCETIDTADAYSRWAPGHTGGESETIIGNWFSKRNNRKDVILCTKVGADMGKGKRDISKAYIVSAAEASLKRLQTDYIDLYQTHWDDNVTPVDETLSAYDELVRAGKVRHIGASNISADRLKESLQVSRQRGFPRYQVLQPLYNLYDRDGFEKDFRQICLENNLGVITYFSLASGFLTGKYRDEQDLSKSRRGEFMNKFYTPRGFRILDALEDVALQYQATPAMIALAWLLAQPGVTAPIASATNTAQLKELVAATEIRLDEESIAILRKAAD